MRLLTIIISVLLMAGSSGLVKAFVCWQDSPVILVDDGSGDEKKEESREGETDKNVHYWSWSLWSLLHHTSGFAVHPEAKAIRGYYSIPAQPPDCM